MSGAQRKHVGKKDAKKLRSEGLVPCVIYGGKEQIHFSVEEKQFKPLIFSPEAAFVHVSIDGKEFTCILQEIQYHPVSDVILHADFFEFTPDMEITMHIPVRTKGTSPGILKGGRLVQKYRKVPVKAIPDALPEEIMIDISKLEINDNVKVKDIEAENFTILLNESNMLIGIAVTRAAGSAGDDDSASEEGAEEGGEEAKEEGEEKSE